jgi:hypothetical protein
MGAATLPRHLCANPLFIPLAQMQEKFKRIRDQGFVKA